MYYLNRCRFLLATVCVLSLTACFSVKTMYNQADWLLPWYLDDYVSLNEQQDNLLKSQLQRSLDWHRQQQLPEYANFLDWLAASSIDGIDEIEINTVYKDLRNFGDVLVEALVPGITQIVQAMDDQQLNEFFKNLEENNQRFKAKFIDTSDVVQREKRNEEKLDLIKQWTGSVSPEQKALVQKWSKTRILMGAEYYQSRQNWQQKLKLILLRRDDRGLLEKDLLSLIKDRRQFRPEVLNRNQQSNEAIDKQLYLNLDRSLSRQQREYLVTRLRDIANDFRDLAEQKE